MRIPEKHSKPQRMCPLYNPVGIQISGKFIHAGYWLFFCHALQVNYSSTDTSRVLSIRSQQCNHFSMKCCIFLEDRHFGWLKKSDEACFNSCINSLFCKYSCIWQCFLNLAHHGALSNNHITKISHPPCLLHAECVSWSSRVFLLFSSRERLQSFCGL